MATYFVDGTAAVTSASSGADSIFVQSGALQASTILGLDGNDTINIAENANNASATSGPSINGGAGNDSIIVNALTYSAGQATLFGGSGADTITVSGGSVSLLKTGTGADFVRATAATTVSSMTFGADADDLTFSGTIKEVGFGSGNDNVSASNFTTLSSSLFKLGDGADTIAATISGVSGFELRGDTTNTSAGNDSIDLTIGQVIDLKVKGAGGNDTFNISGVSQSSLIAGNAGNDSIVLSGQADDYSIRGGSGNDTIALTDALTNGFSAVINGGAGNDSIFINAEFSGDATNTDIFGGAGADTVTISGATIESGTTFATFNFSSLSDSTLGSMDVFNLGTANASGSADADFNFSNSAHLDAVGAASAGILFNSVANKATMGANGVVIFSGTLAVSSVTASMATVDTLTLADGEGAVALFATVGGDEYLFMQGGTAGTSDDALVSLAGLSAQTIAIDNSAAVVTFSGDASTT